MSRFRCLPLLVLSLAAQARPTYRIQAVLQPEAGTLAVQCQVTGWKAGDPIHLNQGFSVTSLRLGGPAVPCTFDTAAPALPFRDLGRPLKTPVPVGDRFELSYTGAVKDWVVDVNRIGRDLVELATYASWLPQGTCTDAEGLDFELTLDLPEAYVATTNGEALGQTVSGGRRITRWRSLPATGDVAILASPAFRVVETRTEGFRVESFHTALPEPLLKGEGLALAEAHRGFTHRFGKAATAGFLRLVFSPRGGWMYSRVPLVVSTEPDVVAALAKGTHDPKGGFHGNAHEVAHFWWCIADVSSTHDWINEALAEFSALGATRARFGEEAGQARLRRWAKGAETAKLSILEAPAASEARYVTHYRVAPLLLAVLEHRAGRAVFDGFLRDLYQAHAGKRTATTADLLARLERHLGKEARTFLEAGLSARSLPLARYRAELGLDRP